MANVLVEESSLQAIADAIRYKTGGSDTYKPREMAPAIRNLSGTGVLQNLSVTENGNYTPGAGVDGYDFVSVAVPGGFGAGDEGKVIVNGALMPQSSLTITQNGTYDTTNKNSVVVNVSGSGSPDLMADWDFTQSLTDSVRGKVCTLGNNATRDSSGVHLTGPQQYVAVGGNANLFNRNLTYLFSIPHMDLMGNDGYHRTLLTFGGSASVGTGLLFRATNQGWGIYDGGWRMLNFTGADDLNYWDGKELGLYLGLGELNLYADGVLLETIPFSQYYNDVKLYIGNSRSTGEGGQCWNTTVSRLKIYNGNYFA